MTTPDRSDRLIVATATAEMRPYDRYGKAIAGMSWMPIRYDAQSQRGSFLLRMAPGAKSLPHEHTGGEEFMVLEGELIDDDGAHFKTGDYVSFAPGSRHSSTAPNGCLIAVILGGPNRLIDGDDVE